jgi:hypothetical protein
MRRRQPQRKGTRGGWASASLLHWVKWHLPKILRHTDSQRQRHVKPGSPQVSLIKLEGTMRFRVGPHSTPQYRGMSQGEVLRP